MSRLFSDFLREFEGVVLGGVRDYLEGVWGGIWVGFYLVLMGLTAVNGG